MKRISLLTAILLPFLAGARQSNDQPGIVQALTNHNYIFKAETALPQQGRIQQLSTEFDVRVRPDTVDAYLPYFGRVFVAPINPTEGGIRFTSVDFSYKEVKKKKNRWDITIDVRDAGSVQQLSLTVFDNGTASLRVNDRNRQGISYNGRVVPGPEQ